MDKLQVREAPCKGRLVRIHETSVTKKSRLRIRTKRVSKQEEQQDIISSIDTTTDEDIHNLKMSMNAVKKLLNKISVGDHKTLLGIIWNDKLPKGKRIVRMKNYFVNSVQMDSDENPRASSPRGPNWIYKDPSLRSCPIFQAYNLFKRNHLQEIIRLLQA